MGIVHIYLLIGRFLAAIVIIFGPIVKKNVCGNFVALRKTVHNGNELKFCTAVCNFATLGDNFYENVALLSWGAYFRFLIWTLN